MSDTSKIRRIALALLAGAALGMAALAPAATAGTAADRQTCVQGTGVFVPAQSKGVLNSTKGAAGTYSVRFNKPVARCTKVATLSDCGTLTLRPGEITVTGRPLALDTVVVRTYNSVGTAFDHAFYLYVSCE